MTVNRGLVEDPVFSGDLAGRAGNRGNLGRTLPLTRLFFQKSGYVGLWPPARRAYASERYWGSTYIATFRMRGVGRYTEKPYTLEKIGVAVKEELEK